MSKERMVNQQEESLNLNDLLDDEKTDELSEYLALSIESLGEDTKVSITTIEDNPTTYSSTLNGVSFNDLQCLLDESLDFVEE